MSESLPQSQHPKLPHLKKMGDEQLAIVSKLTTRPEHGSNPGRNRSIDMPDASILGRIAGHTASNNNDAKNLFQVLPDMDMARSILVSAILSPTDMVSTCVHYSLVQNELDDNLTGPMLRIIQDYFDNTYRIKKFLSDMLSDALFMKGAYPLLILPEVSLDYAITSTSRVAMESVKDEVDAKGWYRPYGILGTPDQNGAYKTSLESLWDYKPEPMSADKEKFCAFDGFAAANGKVTLEGKVYVSDNPAVLRNPMLLDKMRKQRQAEIYGRRSKANGAAVPAGTTTGMETETKETTSMTLGQTEKMFYRNKSATPTPMQMMLTPNQLERKTVGNPLTMNLPTESIIPVHVPGDPRKHVGYFVLLDINGNPLTINYRDDFYSDIRASMNNDSGMSAQLLNMARRNTTGNTGWNDSEIDYMQRAYQQVVETDLLNRLRSGAVTGEYELGNCQEVYRLMFARSLSAKNTMLLYVPAEMMIYIAFDYNDYGVGKSLLEDGKILGSLRSVLLFASTMAAVRNSVDGRNINLTIPEEDENPYETVAFMLGEYAKINRAGFPIGETHPAQLITHLQNAGTVVTVQGNTAFPEARCEVESRDNNHKTIDKDFDDELRRRHYQTFHLSPETMEAAGGADFATTVVNQHLMLLKRVIHYQEEFTPFLTDLVRTYTLNSGFLLDQLRAVVESNKKLLPKEYKDNLEDFIADFIYMIEIGLPSPETNRLEDQMRGYDTYTDAVTKAVDAYLKAEALNPLSPMGLEENLDSIKAAIISMMQRKYLREKNILPELDLFNSVVEGEGGPAFDLLDETQKYNEGVLKSVEGFIKKVVKEAKKRQDRLSKEQEELEALKGGVTGGDAADDTFAEGGDDLPAGDGLDDGLSDAGLDGGGGLDGLDGLDDTGGLDAGGDIEADAGLDDLPADDAPIDSTEPAADATETADAELDPLADLPVDDAAPADAADAEPAEPAEPEVEEVIEPAESEAEEEPVVEEEEEIDLDIPEKPTTLVDDDEAEPADIDLDIPETPKGDEPVEPEVTEKPVVEEKPEPEVPEVPADEEEEDKKDKDKDKS